MCLKTFQYPIWLFYTEALVYSEVKSRRSWTRLFLSKFSHVQEITEKKNPSQPELLHYSWRDESFKRARFISSVVAPLNFFRMIAQVPNYAKWCLLNVHKGTLFPFSVLRFCVVFNTNFSHISLTFLIS